MERAKNVLGGHSGEVGARDGKPRTRAINMSLGILTFFAVCALAAAEERPPVRCIENSPERRGEEGCTILASRPLVASMKNPTYWHIDRFDSLEAATKAAGPDGVPAEAHGSVWLMTVEPRTEEHRGGRHVAWIGPLAVPAAGGYLMRVQSSLLSPGTTTPVHTHSGPEVFYVVAGEQCLDTPQIGQRLSGGQSHILPTGVIHRGRVIGSGVRRALALILHDSALPASHDLGDPPPLVRCE
jgi:quercetin dioxygenase-like cupin family protein